MISSYATKRRAAALGGSVAFMALACSTALGQDRAYAFGVDQTFRHDSNLFRVPSGQARTSDTSSSTGLLGELVLPVGRQHFYANGNLRENRYRDTRSLDNRSYGLDLGVNWATAERLSGTVNYAINESLAPFGIDSRALVTTQRNELRMRQLNAVVRMGLVTRWSVEASAQHRAVAYSAPEYMSLNYEQDHGSLGLRFSPDPSLTLGIGARHTKGRYPQYQPLGSGSFTADRYTRDDIDLLGTWSPTGKSTFTGRAGYGWQTNRQATQRDFKAATGSLSWSYQVTGKLGLTATAIRDTGAETRFAGSINTAGQFSGNDISRLSNALQLAARYDLSSKFHANGALNLTRRTLVDTTAGAAGGISGKDRTQAASVGLRYTPSRNWALECNLGRERRSSETALSYGYSANVARCFAQFLAS